MLDRKKKGRAIARVNGFLRYRELGGGLVEILDSPSHVRDIDTVLVRGYLEQPAVPFAGGGLTFNQPDGDVPPGSCLVVGGQVVGFTGRGNNRAALWNLVAPVGALVFEIVDDPATGAPVACLP